jgi:hypothetical protein
MPGVLGFLFTAEVSPSRGAFTVELYQTGAKLSENRFVDRQHATVALPYCDYFITSDTDLIKRCSRVKGTLRFDTAKVLTGDEFIAMLATL